MKLREAVQKQKDHIIERLISADIYELWDGRQLHEGTLTELERELQSIHKSKGVLGREPKRA